MVEASVTAAAVNLDTEHGEHKKDKGAADYSELGLLVNHGARNTEVIFDSCALGGNSAENADKFAVEGCGCGGRRIGQAGGLLFPLLRLRAPAAD